MIEGAMERAQLDPRTEFYLAVTLPNDELIGFARLALDGVQAGKLGYAIRDRWQYEGRIRDHVHTNGAWRDSLLYSVLAHEWARADDAADRTARNRRCSSSA